MAGEPDSRPLANLVAANNPKGGIPDRVWQSMEEAWKKRQQTHDKAKAPAKVDLAGYAKDRSDTLDSFPPDGISLEDVKTGKCLVPGKSYLAVRVLNAADKHVTAI